MMERSRRSEAAAHPEPVANTRSQVPIERLIRRLQDLSRFLNEQIKDNLIEYRIVGIGPINILDLVHQF